jgi:choline dehydrogenase
VTQSAFDHVIVGAGSAGCVLAARLTEDPDCRVLLLEAGPWDRSWRIRMPAAVGTLLASTRFNWSFQSEPEPHLGGRRLVHPRGRVVGGSSSINGMVYVRGHARDYDAWAQAGARGWGYTDILPYFRRAETRAGGGDAYRGGDGPLHVDRPDLAASPLAEAFLAAGLEAGYPRTDDVNGRQQEGFGPIDRTTRGGERWSAARAYLHPAAGRPNLTIVTGALALGVRLEGGRAVGVDYATDGRTGHAAAERGVILAAGAFGSPHLLQLSGIGAPDHLRTLGVPVRHELPAVGENLNDHPDIVVQQRCRRRVSLHPVTRPPGKWLAGLSWFAARRGPAATNHFEAGAFIRGRAGVEHPDLQLTFMPLAVTPGTVDSVGEHAFQVHIDLMRPKSLGRVRARSADPREPPAIRFNYLAEPEDRADLREAVKLTREILAQPALAPFAGDELLPGREVRSDAAIDAWIGRTVETCYHPVGTCRMGRPQDRRAVVDDELRVHGLDGLRVVDASVMPAIVSGNTNAPTIMIAEKAADLIRGRPSPPPAEVPVWIHPRWEEAQR